MIASSSCWEGQVYNDRKTYYNVDNARFSDLAHKAAIDKIYPKMYPNKRIRIEDCTGFGNEASKILDGQRATDYILHIPHTIPNTSTEIEIPITIQERFLQMSKSKYESVTVTVYNNRSSLASELGKLHANKFLFAYFDGVDSFGKVIVLDNNRLIDAIVKGEIAYRVCSNNKEQTFYCIPFSECDRLKIIDFSLN